MSYHYADHFAGFGKHFAPPSRTTPGEVQTIGKHGFRLHFAASPDRTSGPQKPFVVA